MNGPSFNVKFAQVLSNYQEDELPKLIDIWICHFHFIHGAVQTGDYTARWNINKVLKAPLQLWHDSLARRNTLELFLIKNSLL